MKIFISKNKLISLAGIILLLFFWKLAAVFAESNHIVPSPEKTLISTWKILSDPGLWPSIFTTLLRGLAGFGISLFLALLTGIPAGLNTHFFQLINPLIVTIRSTPVISIILLAIIWLGNEGVPVFIAILTMFPVLCINIIEGMRDVDKDLIEMSRLYKVKPVRIIKEVYLPSIAPFLTGGISNAFGFGWRAIIIGEVLGQPRLGIGTRMYTSQAYLLVSEVIAWTLIAILISYIFELIIRKLEKKIIVWKRP